MNLALNDVRANITWKTPFNRSYMRAAMYWLGVLAAVLLVRNIQVVNFTTTIELGLATPVAIWVLAELSRQLRRYANFISLMVAPDLEFSSRGLLALHAIRSLLIVTELAVTLAIAVMLVFVVQHS